MGMLAQIPNLLALNLSFVDKRSNVLYINSTYRQFETILSLNKTTGGWAQCALFVAMRYKTKNLVYGAMIGALYAALCFLQNALIPNSASFVIQFRAAEALCVLAMFTPAAIPGLTIGCVLFNLCMAGALPWDVPLGGFATLLAAWGTYATRKWTIKGFPVIALVLPAITNGFLIGWELTAFIGDAFWINALYVAIGELAVLFTLGNVLYFAIKRRRLLEK